MAFINIEWTESEDMTSLVLKDLLDILVYLDGKYKDWKGGA